MAFVEQNKEKTFTIVFDKNYEALCLYAVKFTEDFLEAEDIVQEVCTFLGNVSRSFDHGKCPAFIVSDDTKYVCGSCPGETQKRCGCGSNDRSTGLLFSAGIRR